MVKEIQAVYRLQGVKINDNTYSGFLFCGDCGSPMFAMSRSDLKDAYRCGEYHKRGLKACTSHHIRVDKLDEVVKAYVRKVKDSSNEMLARLNADLDREDEDIEETERSAEHLAEVLADLQEELKATKRQRIRDIMKHPENEETLEETYDELENDLLHRIEGLNHQIAMTEDKQVEDVTVDLSEGLLYIVPKDGYVYTAENGTAYTKSTDQDGKAVYAFTDADGKEHTAALKLFTVKMESNDTLVERMHEAGKTDYDTKYEPQMSPILLFAINFILPFVFIMLMFSLVMRIMAKKGGMGGMGGGGAVRKKFSFCFTISSRFAWMISSCFVA